MLGIGVFVASHAPGSGTILPQTKILGEFKDRVYQDGGTAESYSCAESSLLPLLLDPETFTTGLLEFYPGASAAYSLRQLRRSVSPYAIRVRRSSDDTELDIGFTSNGDLDLVALLDFAGTGDACVSIWYDQSSNGNDAEQSTPANQPKIVSSGSLITENGKPALAFDGSNDDLRSNNEIMNGNALFIASVVKNTSDASSMRIVDQSGPSAGAGLFATNTANADVVRTFARFDSISYSMNDTTNYTNTQALMVVNWASGASALHVNASQRATDTSTWTAGGDTNVVFSIGSDGAGEVDYLEGTLQELLVYTTDQSANREGIESNVNNFYSIYL